MRVVNVHEAKSQLSRLLEQVIAGDEILIARAGKPVARLVAYVPGTSPRQPGIWQGKVAMSPDFDELPELLRAAFAGEEP